jgi:ABC-2 type transport system permease protein
MRQVLAITRKELAGYFGSPLALIFLSAFVGVTLFVFFWVDAFFARGISDVRPLFQWMPLLLIFLVAALTMRQWSEEQRSGTLEMLMTLPVKPWQLVVGKFLAVMGMVALALLLTLPLPVTVALLGNLDWGPVIGGYLAALLLGAAYAAIGLFISALTDNQIVALILTVLLGGLFYLVGTGSVTDFFGESVGGLLRNIGTGSRFESIQRGVIDLRDLVYYLTLAAAFLIMNVWLIERKRWGHGDAFAADRRNATLFASLAIINLLLVNVWMGDLRGLRADLTQQREYSLSPVTKELLTNLQEPLLIRAYISERSHPLLGPLRPQVEDMLREYGVAGGSQVTAEVVDPATNPELEVEATQTYAIQPTPFQVEGRYEASVINAYFDILVRYGDQDVVLNFQDLINVQANRSGGMDVGLRNLEYDLTSAVKKVVYGFQSADAVLAALDEPVTLTLYVTPDMLPAELADAPATISQVAEEIAATSGGKLVYQQVNPDDPSGGVTREQLIQEYALQAFPVSLFGTDSYFLHMVLQNGENAQIIYPAGTISEGAVRTSIESALKRSADGFLKSIGLWTPPAVPVQDMFGQMQQPLQSWQIVEEHLRREYTVIAVDLSSGLPPENIDALLVLMPENLDDKARYAIDQYLMRGGAVIVAAGNYKANVDPMGNLGIAPIMQGLRAMLNHYGVDVQDGIVMDLQNVPFPLPVMRDVGGMTVQEIQAVNFPSFVDVRADGMNAESGVTAGLASATLAWTSPVVAASGTATRTAATILSSSSGSWLTTNTTLAPDMQAYPDMGYPIEGEQQAQPLGVAITGIFDSFFAGQPSPLAQGEEGNAPAGPLPGTIAQSPDTARLVVFGSSEFVDDAVLQVLAQMIGDQAMNNVQLIQNSIDWAVEDADLATMRGRGASVRLLEPLSEQEQTTWEIGNYLLAIFLVVGIGGYFLVRSRNQRPMELEPSDEVQV